MKLVDYKGYEISVSEVSGKFSINDISGWFERYKDATAKIDAVIRAEAKGNFPIEMISSSMEVGKITSYNKLEKSAWFSREGGRREKARITDYNGEPRFYKATAANLNLVLKYKGLSDEIGRLSKERKALEKQLTEPIIFEEVSADLLSH